MEKTYDVVEILSWRADDIDVAVMRSLEGDIEMVYLHPSSVLGDVRCSIRRGCRFRIGSMQREVILYNACSYQLVGTGMVPLLPLPLRFGRNDAVG